MDPATWADNPGAAGAARAAGRQTRLLISAAFGSKSGAVKIDFTGKRVLVAGVADDVGFGFAIAKQFAEAGAKVCIAGWPPALGIFETVLRRGKLDESRKMSDGSLLEFERVYPLDASFD